MPVTDMTRPSLPPLSMAAELVVDAEVMVVEELASSLSLMFGYVRLIILAT